MSRAEPRPVRGRLVEFVAEDGIVLNGFLSGPDRSKRCLIYVHGMTGNFYGGRMQFALAEKLASLGVSVFSVNTRGHDIVSSIRVRKGRKTSRVMGGTDLERFEDSALDIGAAIGRLHRLGFAEFVLAGHSTGCQKVTYYQYKKRDRRVKGILLLAPADDYAIYSKELGRKLDETVRECRKLVRKGLGNEPTRNLPSHFSPKRLLSVVDRRNVEARLFDYSGELREFSRITQPICAVFGSKEEYATEPVVEYLRTLRQKTSSSDYVGVVVNGADHSFRNHSEALADFVSMWIKRMGRKGRIPMQEIVEVHSKFPLALLGYS